MDPNLSLPPRRKILANLLWLLANFSKDNFGIVLIEIFWKTIPEYERQQWFEETLRQGSLQLALYLKSQDKILKVPASLQDEIYKKPFQNWVRFPVSGNPLEIDFNHLFTICQKSVARLFSFLEWHRNAFAMEMIKIYWRSLTLERQTKFKNFLESTRPKFKSRNNNFKVPEHLPLSDEREIKYCWRKNRITEESSNFMSILPILDEEFQHRYLWELCLSITREVVDINKISEYISSIPEMFRRVIWNSFSLEEQFLYLDELCTESNSGVCHALFYMNLEGYLPLDVLRTIFNFYSEFIPKKHFLLDLVDDLVHRRKYSATDILSLFSKKYYHLSLHQKFQVTLYALMLGYDGKVFFESLSVLELIYLYLSTTFPPERKEEELMWSLIKAASVGVVVTMEEKDRGCVVEFGVIKGGRKMEVKKVRVVDVARWERFFKKFGEKSKNRPGL